ncbi:MAG: hypothetical protein ABIQ53_11870 [Terracoccus sp.]
MQTTISIDSALLKQARGYAKSAGLSWNDFAEQALRAHLDTVDPGGAVVVEPTGEVTRFVVVPEELAMAEGAHDYGWQR